MVLRWPSQQGGEKGQNTWDLICSQLPNLWAGFPRAAPTLNGFSSPISSCRPTQLLSQLPTPLTRAKTSNSCPEERFQRFFFFFQGENWTNPSSTHPGSCPCFVGKGVGRAGGTGAAHLLGKRAVGGGQRQWWGGEPSPLCTPHSAPNSPSKEGILPLRASLIAQLVKNPPAMQETLVRFLSQEDPLEKD